MTALAHYLVLKYLDGRRSDGDGSVPQQYVTVASILLSNIFRAALVLSLSVAFTQYMWHVMRTSSLKISTIEHLYGIRENFMLLLYPAVVQATPILFLLAGLSWMVQVAAIYPPGALTIRSTAFENRYLVSVPSFNATTTQLQEGLGALAVVQLASVTSEASALHYEFPVPSLQRLTRQVLSAGEITRETSPCGPNCTFTTLFEGPYMKCSEPKSANISTKFSNETFVINSEGINFLYNGKMGGNASDTTSNFSTATFDFYTSRIIGFWPKLKDVDAGYASQPDADSNYIWESTNVTCTPWRGTYTVNTTWQEGTRSLRYAVEPIEQLTNIRNAPMMGDKSHNAWTRDVNIMSIFESLVTSLTGNYSSMVGPDVGPHANSSLKFELDNGTVVDLDGVNVVFQGEHWNHPEREFGANGTIIGDTRFNRNANIFVASNNSAQQTMVSGPDIHLSPDDLNDALFNITMSTAIATNLWPVDTSSTILQYHNTYAFHPQKVLLLPYGLSLIVAIPFLLIGAWALWSNGVPAADGGIIQLLCTTTGSRMLERTAAAGCLGGDGNVPRELSEMKIRFGEIVGSGSDLGSKNGAVVKRAGFGVESELGPLRKGEAYGYS
jgi:hypothetical protein